MAEEDIYKNKEKYRRYLETLSRLLEPPTSPVRRGQRKYHCKNPENLKYFWKLHSQFEARDSSYQARLRLFQTLLHLTSLTNEDLVSCDRDDIDMMMANGNSVNQTKDSRETFLRNVKRIWKRLFPELDDRGRIMDEIVPYPVRHISARVDRSRQKRRKDRLTDDELEKLIKFFATDLRMQAFITLAIESLGRPQEICFTRVGDFEAKNGSAKIWVSDHGKEGVKFLHCIESFPYVSRWLAVHPHQGDPNAFLFLASRDSSRQLRPENINRMLRIACKRLGIEKRITGYSLKRNGVTRRRLNGDSDVVIQHVAGWTSTRQLSIYDLSSADDVFAMQLEKKRVGETADGENSTVNRACRCGAVLAPREPICRSCGHVVDPKALARDLDSEREIRAILSLALRARDRSLAEIIEEYRAR